MGWCLCGYLVLLLPWDLSNRLLRHLVYSIDHLPTISIPTNSFDDCLERVFKPSDGLIFSAKQTSLCVYFWSNWPKICGECYLLTILFVSLSAVVWSSIFELTPSDKCLYAVAGTMSEYICCSMNHILAVNAFESIYSRSFTTKYNCATSVLSQPAWFSCCIVSCEL